MSDLSFPDDELVSAYLDGEVDAAERGRVEGDPALLARSAELRRASELLRGPVDQPSADDIDRTITAALSRAGSPTVRPLDARRRPGSVPAWLSVAALVLGLLVAVSVVGAIIGGDGDGGDETAALSDSAEEEDLDTTTAGGVAESGGDAPADLESSGPVDLGDLGAISGERALVEAVGPVAAARTAQAADGAGTSGFDNDDGVASTTVPGPAVAAPPRCERPDLGEPVLRATAVYDGTEAVIFGYEIPEGTRVVVLAVDSCGVIADVTL